MSLPIIAITISNSSPQAACFAQCLGSVATEAAALLSEQTLHYFSKISSVCKKSYKQVDPWPITH